MHIAYRNNFPIVQLVCFLQLVRTQDFSNGTGNKAITQLVSSFVSIEIVIIYAPL